MDLALAFLEKSAETEDAARLAEEERRRAELRKARIIAFFAIALAFMTVLASWAVFERYHAQEAEEDAKRLQEIAQCVEERRTRDLFDFQITHASLLARMEDYANAKQVLAETLGLDDRILANRRLTRDLLARYAAIMGGAAEQVYKGTGAQLFSVDVSPDGRWVAACGEHGTVVLFDTESDELVQRLEGHDPEVRVFGRVWDVGFHPQGDWLASAGDDKRIILWSLPTENEPAAKVREWEAPDTVTSLAVSPDGKLLASGGLDKAITIWDPETGEARRTLEGHRAQISEISGLAFSPNSSRLASASYDGTARIWDVETGAQKTSLTRHPGRVQGVAVSADGRSAITSGQDHRVILWDTETGDPLRIYSGHGNSVTGAGFAPRPGEPNSAPLIVAAGLDRSIRIWDSDSAVAQNVLQGHEAGVGGIAIRDGTLYSASNDGTIRRWSLALPHQRLLDLPGEPKCASVSPGGSLVAVGFDDGRIRIYGLPGLELRSEYTDAHEGRVKRLALSPDGKLLASAGLDDKLARLWRIAADGALEPLLDLTGHEQAVHDVAFSPDGRTLATAGYDGRIGLFDTETGEGRFIQSTKGRTLSVAFDPTGARVFAGDRDDGKVHVWDIETDPPALIREIKAASDQLLWAEPSADGSRIAAVGRDLVLSVLDAKTGEPLVRLPGHEQTVFKARFLPGGRQVATVSADATVRLWDLDTKSQLFALQLPTNRYPPTPLWDFDLRCTPRVDIDTNTEADGQGAGTCWLVVPLTRGKLAVYDLGPLPAGLAP